ncbi:ORF6N domain-containing protein [Salmonella enterica]|nr:ORF6N domain-containing protein [Salmonella enterica]
MTKAISLHNSRIPLVEYQGQRVVTFAMVDDAHQRPKGTARAAFNRNRHRFIEGEDSYLVDYSEKNVLRTFGIDVPFRGLRVLTESGYLLLTKPFDDELSWKVQRQLVKAYFRRFPKFPDLQDVHIPEIHELAAMPLAEAQNLLAKAERESFTEHGQKGSAGMILRREELKKLRPALCLIGERSQLNLPGVDHE